MTAPDRCGRWSPASGRRGSPPSCRAGCRRRSSRTPPRRRAPAARSRADRRRRSAGRRRSSGCCHRASRGAPSPAPGRAPRRFPWPTRTPPAPHCPPPRRSRRTSRPCQSPVLPAHSPCGPRNASLHSQAYLCIQRNASFGRVRRSRLGTAQVEAVSAAIWARICVRALRIWARIAASAASGSRARSAAAMRRCSSKAAVARPEKRLDL